MPVVDPTASADSGASAPSRPARQTLSAGPGGVRPRPPLHQPLEQGGATAAERQVDGDTWGPFRHLALVAPCFQPKLGCTLGSLAT